MRILILDDASEGLAAIESAIQGHQIQIRRADAVEPNRLYVFAGWTLEETARDLVSRAGRRVDLTSSEFDLLMAFLRQPGQALSRDALLGVLRGREWTYFDRSIDTLVARLRKKLADGADRPRWFARCAASAIYSAPPSRACAMQDSLLPSQGCATQDSLPPHEAAPATSSTGGSGCLSVRAATSGRSTRGPRRVAQCEKSGDDGERPRRVAWLRALISGAGPIDALRRRLLSIAASAFNPFISARDQASPRR
jgi:hypothetical protein